MGRLGLLVGLLATAAAAAGCFRTFKGEAVQPNPLVRPTETLRVSEPIVIVRGDMDLVRPRDPQGTGNASQTWNQRYPLVNQASFTIVSRDRLRFHVSIDHKWEDWADLHSWEVYLEDNTGKRWVPEGIEHARTTLMTTMWDREQRSKHCPGGSDVNGNCYGATFINNDGWRNRQTLGSLSVFRGKADFVFYERDIFHPLVTQLRLVVKRSGEAFEFTWRFRDTVASH